MMKLFYATPSPFSRKVRVVAIEKALEKEHTFDFVIGMLDPSEQKHLVSEHKNRHMFWFEDIISQMDDRQHPTKEHVLDIIKLFDEHSMKDKLVLVHCHAGISRSTAVAIGLLIHSGKRISEAFETIHWQRDMMWPNDLILKHFDDILNLGGELVKFDKDWKNSHRNTFWLPSDGDRE